MKNVFFLMLLALCSLTITTNAQTTLTTVTNPGPAQEIAAGSQGIVLLAIQLTSSPSSTENVALHNFGISVSGPLPNTFTNIVLRNSNGVPLSVLTSASFFNNLSLQATIAPGTSATFYLWSDVDTTCTGGCYQVALQSVFASGETTNNTIIVANLPSAGQNTCVTHPLAYASIDSVPPTICQGTSFIPSFSAGWLNYPFGVPSCTPLLVNWNFGQNASVTNWNSTAPVPPVYFYQAGTHTIYLTLTDPSTGISTSLQTNIDVYPNLYQNIWLSGGYQLNCLTDTLTLNSNVSPAFGPQWYWNGALVGTDSTLTVTEPGNYVLLITANNVCSQPNTPTQIVTRDNFSVTILGNGATVDTFAFCDGQTASLNVYANSTNGQTFEWSNGSIAQWTTVNTGGEYSVTATNTIGCTTTDTIYVTLMTLPAPLLVLSDTTAQSCGNNPLTISAPGGYHSYNWAPVYSQNENATAYQTGNYTVTVMDDNGCTAVSETVAITVHQTPNPFLLVDTEHCALAAQPDNGTTFTWLLNGTELTTTTSAYYSANSTGWYGVNVTNEFGCSGSANPVYMDCTATGINDVTSAESVTLFPNPTTDVLHITATPTIEGGTITNMIGDEIIKIMPTQEGVATNVDVTTLAPGIYFLHGRIDGKIFSKKFVKQ